MTPPVRRLLLALTLFGAGGLILELLLLEHTEWPWQWIPLATLGAALLGGAVLVVRPTRSAVRFLRAAMALSVAAGLLGVYLHFRGNAEWEREGNPERRGPGLFWESLHGATPALAPAAMVQLGLLGLLCTFRHPALRRGGPAHPFAATGGTPPETS